TNCIPIEDDDARVYIEAKRTIRAGEELSYDYRLSVPGRITAKMNEGYACRCGAPRCRGTMLEKKKRRSASNLGDTSDACQRGGGQNPNRIHARCRHWCGGADRQKYRAGCPVGRPRERIAARQYEPDRHRRKRALQHATQCAVAEPLEAADREIAN